MQLIVDYTAKKRPEAVEVLLNMKDSEGFAPLHHTCFLGRHNCLEYLLSFFPNAITQSLSPGQQHTTPREKDKSGCGGGVGESPLVSNTGSEGEEGKQNGGTLPSSSTTTSRDENDEDKADAGDHRLYETPEWQHRLKAQIDLLAADNEKMTCLHWAVRFLLSPPLSVVLAFYLYLISRKGHLRITKTLLDSGGMNGSQYLRLKNNLGRTPLHEACVKGADVILVTLLDKMDKNDLIPFDAIDFLDANGDNLLHGMFNSVCCFTNGLSSTVAVQGGSKECVNALLQRFSSPESEHIPAPPLISLQKC